MIPQLFIYIRADILYLITVYLEEICQVLVVGLFSPPHICFHLRLNLPFKADNGDYTALRCIEGGYNLLGSIRVLAYRRGVQFTFISNS